MRVIHLSDPPCTTSAAHMQARYYNGAHGQFISQDPAFWILPTQLLLDPQQQNSYAYARNNPISQSDPTGQLVQLESRPVFDIQGHIVGVHTFFMVNPDHPEQIQIAGVTSGATAFTFGGYPSGTGYPTDYLTKGIGTAQSTGMDTAYAFGNAKVLNKTTITPPDGESDTQFINKMGAQFNSIDLTGMRYMGTGHISGLYDGNSNNFAYTLGVKSGVQSQMNAFNPNPNNQALVGARGYGTMLPTTSIYREVIAGLTAIKNSLAILG